MSKYLDWYNSSLVHTATEKMAKNEIESAHRKIKHATEALAKANERVKELEHRCEMLERVEKIFNESPELTFDEVQEMFSNELNKFTLEHWIEAIEVFTDSFIEANYKHETPLLGRKYNDKMRGALLNALKKSSEKTCEKLRKGGES